MKTYASFSHTDFYLALGYKAEVIKDYFLHYQNLNAVSEVHPSARFGELEISENRVTLFQEKPQTSQGWINA